MLQIIDSYDKIQTLFKTGAFQLEQWELYAAGLPEPIFQMVKEDAAKYDFDRQILPVLEHLFSHQELAETAHRSFVRATDGLEEKCAHLPGGGVKSTIVFYLGLCCAAGWAVELHGEPAVLFGLEKIVELGWVDETSMIGLIYHELGHNWHFQNRKVPPWNQTPQEKALWQMYTEGVAMWFEQFLCGSRRFYPQDRGGWLAWCEVNRERLAKAYKKRLETDGNVQDFFGDWCSFEGHSDAGYFLGGEIARRVEEERGVEFLLNMQADDFWQYLAGMCR